MQLCEQVGGRLVRWREGQFGRGARSGKDVDERTAGENALAFANRLRRPNYYEIKLRKRTRNLQYQIGPVRRLGGAAAAAQRVGQA